ncbi:phasin family protein [Luteibacter aegosomatissinici]|uniref:phasin family protein n=1 Tax=Luteibacter aegosomatissinici TaxID=2911539 RepID=UPI001FF94DE8|nr:phasin family protein [Luteibacter aegosomatissinici]UPG94787.1 phasin family protein [Luteibacter aegosomatissinici]
MPHVNAYADLARFVEQATAAQAVAWRGMERVADLHLQALEGHARAATGLMADAMMAQDADALRAMFVRGGDLQREGVERAATAAGDIMDVAVETATSLGALVAKPARA